MNRIPVAKREFPLSLLLKESDEFFYSFAEERVALIYSASGHERLLSLWALSALLKDILQLQPLQTLQHTTTHCNTLSLSFVSSAERHSTHCNTLQHTATPCNILQPREALESLNLLFYACFESLGFWVVEHFRIFLLKCVAVFLWWWLLLLLSTVF